MSRSAHVRKRTEWLDRLRRFRRANLSVSEFCRREQVSVPSYYQWRRKLADGHVRGGRSAPSRPRSSQCNSPVQLTCRLSFPNGARLTLPALDHELVRMSIEAIALTRTSQGGA